MKEFAKTNKVTYNLMSFTGYKALILFSLLTEGPKSYQDVSEYFLNHPYLREKISIDTLRVYMNSLKRLGCEIKRIKGEDKISRYMIVQHPFELQLSREQIQSVMKVFKSIVKNIDIKELVAMEGFFEKIGGYIKNEDFVNEVKKISMLKDVNIPILKELIECCDKKDRIVISYNSPNSGQKDIEMIADKIESNNGKIYLYGSVFEYNQYTYFPVSRIEKINEIKLNNKDLPFNLNKLTVTYEVNTNGENFEPAKNEKIIKQTKTKVTVEAETSNEFVLRQRLLAFGPECKIIEPEQFKIKFINLLKDMKAGYYCD